MATEAEIEAAVAAMLSAEPAIMGMIGVPICTSLARAAITAAEEIRRQSNKVAPECGEPALFLVRGAWTDI